MANGPGGVDHAARRRAELRFDGRYVERRVPPRPSAGCSRGMIGDPRGVPPGRTCHLAARTPLTRLSASFVARPGYEPPPSPGDAISISMASASSRPASKTRRWSATVQLSQYGRSGSAAIAAMSYWRNGSRSPLKHVSTIAAHRPNTRDCHGASEDELAVPSRRGGGTVNVQQLGVHSRATPIIESRVTRSASSSSDRPSVPAGLSGTTR